MYTYENHGDKVREGIRNMSIEKKKQWIENNSKYHIEGWKLRKEKGWIPKEKKIKKIHKYSYKYKYRTLELLEKKRFTNQRYRARKKMVMGSHTFNEWLLLKAYYQYMCLCCKRQEPEIKLTEDHIMPLSMGGSDAIENIQPLCVSCNTRKHAKFISYLPINYKTLDYRKEEVKIH